ncbi:hypothetical protein ACQ4PT_015495 [Festuca glaucescens]
MREMELGNTRDDLSVSDPASAGAGMALCKGGSDGNARKREAGGGKGKGKDSSMFTSAKDLLAKDDSVLKHSKFMEEGNDAEENSGNGKVRREKISQRMKLMQDLVPGCNKVVGKVVMLDEIINYVQSLQRQVEVPTAMVARLSQLWTKVAQAAEFASKLGGAYYKEAMEKNRRYIVQFPTMEKCHDLSKHDRIFVLVATGVVRVGVPICNILQLPAISIPACIHSVNLADREHTMK